jgi:hypothetical protein
MNLLSLIPSPYNYVAVAVLATVLIGGAYTAGFYHESLKFNAYKAALQQQAVDQQKHTNLINKDNAQDTAQVQHEAQADITNPGNTINSLSDSVQHDTVTACEVPNTTTAATGSGVTADRPTVADTATSPSVAPKADQPDTVTLQKGEAQETVQAAIDAVQAEILWRQWAQGINTK